MPALPRHSAAGGQRRCPTPRSPSRLPTIPSTPRTRGALCEIGGPPLCTVDAMALLCPELASPLTSCQSARAVPVMPPRHAAHHQGSATAQQDGLGSAPREPEGSHRETHPGAPLILRGAPRLGWTCRMSGSATGADLSLARAAGPTQFEVAQSSHINRASSQCCTVEATLAASRYPRAV
jgi:hypothetical protein